MHEFVSFAKSPYDMIAYDERSSYDLTPHNPSQEQPGDECVCAHTHTHTHTHTPSTSGPSPSGPSGAPSVPSGDRVWPIVEPYNATATITHTDNSESFAV